MSKDLLMALFWWFVGVLLFIIPWFILVWGTAWIVKLIWGG